MTVPISDRWPTSPWLAGLDGLRAIAVLAVVTFHFLPGVLPGGFLGVDLFFVISGYLITRLLLAEIDMRGRLDLLDFYRRRMRRLLPAVVVLVVVAVTAAATCWPDELVGLRGGAPSGLFYVGNWWLIGQHQPYFVASGRPPLLQHLWSLGIEEQFYLLWPCVLAILLGSAVMLRTRTCIISAGSLARVALWCTVLAVLSTALMTWLAVRSDVPYGADSGRVYFGTDTHAMGLLLGSAAGALSIQARFGIRRPVLRGAFISDLAAIGAFAALVLVARRTSEFAPGLYRGGFLAVSALCTVLVAAAPRRGSAVGWLLERAPLRYVGERSYSIYLWHWPVAVLTRPGIDIIAPAPAVLVLRLVLTATLAEASYRVVERPFRRGGLRAVLAAAGWRRLPVLLRERLGPLAAFGALAVLGALVAVVLQATPVQPRPALAAAQGRRLLPTAAPTAAGQPSPAGPSRSAGSRRPSSGRSSASVPRTTAPPAAAPSQAAPAPADLAVSAFGDSVMLGAAPALQATLPHTDVSAVEGRQARTIFADVMARKAAGTLAPVVVVHAGDNGIISADDLAATLDALADRARVVVVTDRVPRDWQDPNNAALIAATRRHRNAVLVDWYGRSAGHRSWFYDDGLHLQPDGAAAYAAMISAAVRGAHY